MVLAPRPPVPLDVTVTLKWDYAYARMEKEITGSISGSWGAKQCTQLGNSSSVLFQCEVTRLDRLTLQSNESVLTFSSSLVCSGVGVLSTANFNLQQFAAEGGSDSTTSWGPSPVRGMNGMLNATMSYGIDIEDPPLHASSSSGDEWDSSSSSSSSSSGGGGGGEQSDSGMDSHTKMIIMALGITAGVLAIAALIFCCWKKRTTVTAPDFPERESRYQSIA